MGLYERYLLPRLVTLSLGTKEAHEQRAKALREARGRVLEIGFGNGLNLRHYPQAVTEVVGVDPSPASEKLARKDIAACPFPVTVHEGSAEQLPFEAASFDSAAITWTLCTIPDPGAALGEIRRVLRPAGRLFFLEHGRSTDAGVARWQHRLNGIQRFVGGGCNLDREIGRLIMDAEFRIEALENSYMKGPKTHTFLYLGVAAPEGAGG